jgi:hypothetical protein
MNLYAALALLDSAVNDGELTLGVDSEKGEDTPNIKHVFGNGESKIAHSGIKATSMRSKR